MQKLCEFEALCRPEIQCKCLKTCFKITKILVVENVIYIFTYYFANVGIKPECKG